MSERPTVAEMRVRLVECARHYGGAVPRDAALMWDGYFAALIEWGLVSPAEHAELLGLLPPIPASPVMGVFLGWDRGQAESPAASDPAASGSPAAWAVWRIDDNANTFRVRGGLSLAEAERVAAEFTARGHKQMYWVEREAAEPLGAPDTSRGSC